MSSQARVCIPNIGPRARRQRLLGGVAAGAGALVLAGLFMGADLPRATRILVGIPVFLAVMGFLQYREST